VGATGAVALRLVERLLADGWTVIGLCRHPPATSPSTRLAFVQADLFDANDCARALRGHADITHAFYTARAKHGETGTESIPENAAMLAATLDAVQPVARALAHVHRVEGGRWYGLQLGP
jgi:nucleoside-diphosphate-sugar epimerase